MYEINATVDEHNDGRCRGSYEVKYCIKPKTKVRCTCLKNSGSKRGKLLPYESSKYRTNQHQGRE
jgi:hypothetical protein